MKKLGTYQLGHEWVDVQIDPSTKDAAVFWVASQKKNTQIVIGINDSEFWEVYGSLLHEAFEAVADTQRLRYKHASSFAKCSDAFLFVMDHRQYTEVCARVGAFIESVHDDLKKAYDKHYNGKS